MAQGRGGKREKLTGLHCVMWKVFFFFLTREMEERQSIFFLSLSIFGTFCVRPIIRERFRQKGFVKIKFDVDKEKKKKNQTLVLHICTETFEKLWLDFPSLFKLRYRWRRKIAGWGKKKKKKRRKPTAYAAQRYILVDCFVPVFGMIFFFFRHSRIYFFGRLTKVLIENFFVR